MMCQIKPVDAVNTGASQGPFGLQVLYTNASEPKCIRPIMFVYSDMVYQLFSCKWYAAMTLTRPTAMFHVPNVRAERAVTGDVGGSAVTIEATDGLRPSGGVMRSSSNVRVMLVVFVLGGRGSDPGGL